LIFINSTEENFNFKNSRY